MLISYTLSLNFIQNQFPLTKKHTLTYTHSDICIDAHTKMQTHTYSHTDTWKTRHTNTNKRA